MKNTVALICELNPLHSGHKYIIDKAKTDADAVILVMSGNFCERGTPAVFDKYARAEAAVKCGADIVAELPYPWCTDGVEGFARAGTFIASSLGAKRLIFGSESGDASLIETAAKIKASPEYKIAATEAEKANRSHGSAVIFDDAMASLGVRTPLGANDKLGAEYIRHGTEFGIENFYPVKRTAAMSASDLRKMLFSGVDVNTIAEIPAEARSVFRTTPICDERRYNEILFYYCRILSHKSDNEIVRYAAKAAKNSTNADELIANLPTKKYTLARIRRTILSEMIGCPRDASVPDYTVILASSKVGRDYLAGIRKTSPIELITKPAAAKSAMFSSLARADELFSLCAGFSGGEMMRRHPFAEK